MQTQVGGTQGPNLQGQVVTRSRRASLSSPARVCVSHKVDAREYMEDDGALYKALRKVNQAGVVVLENARAEEGTVIDLARRVAPLSHGTLYGDIFDVITQVRQARGGKGKKGLVGE